jgi:hypothetical protein
MLKVSTIEEVGLELVTGLYHCGSPKLERKRKEKNKIEQYRRTILCSTSRKKREDTYRRK